jgi:3-deoxy-7-phosphoheptulonate synthase
MIIVMKKDATEAEIQSAVQTVKDLGYGAHLSRGEERVIIGVLGNDRPLQDHPLAALAGVEKIVPILAPYKLASRDFHPQDTVVRINGVSVGGPLVVTMAGPCSVESKEQLLETARAVKSAGAQVLRGGAFKPRSSPYSFQGLGFPALEMLAEIGCQVNMPVVTEVIAPEDVDMVAQYATILQVGARNMTNFALLQAVGRTQHPIILKRAMSATVEELLMAAEYILAQGNEKIILCERGIRTFEKATRFTLDINAVPVIKKASHLPVIIDPSHATGAWEYVSAVARAAVAVGADGLLIEVHPHPDKALSDGPQQLRPERFQRLMVEVRAVAAAIGRDA